MNKALPKDWKMVKFEDIGIHITEKVSPSDTDLDIYVGLEHLDSESLKMKRWGSPSDVIGEKLRVRPGEIIFGKRRAYQRKLAIAEFDCICSAHAMVLKANEKNVRKDFFPFFLQSDLFMERALEISVGSLSPTINWKTLKAQEFPLPPLAEQKRIAEVLWAVEKSIWKTEDAIGAAERYMKRMMRHLFMYGPLKEDMQNKIEWSENYLGDILSLEYGNGLIKEDRDGGQYPVYGSNGIVGKHSEYLVEGPGIIVGRKGTIGAINWSDSNFFPIDTTYYVKVKNNINLRWIYYLLLAMNLSRLNMATGTPGLNRNIVYNQGIRIPPIEKLNQVTEILDSVNSVFESLLNSSNTGRSLKLKLLNDSLDGDFSFGGDS